MIQSISASNTLQVTMVKISQYDEPIRTARSQQRMRDRMNIYILASSNKCGRSDQNTNLKNGRHIKIRKFTFLALI